MTEPASDGPAGTADARGRRADDATGGVAAASDASHAPAVASEVADLARVAGDGKRTRLERVEAFEDIIDSEVGDTPLARARNIEHKAGLSRLHIKFEGANPTGTHKDRIAFAMALDALRRGYDGVSVASAGNYGVAIAFATSLAGLRCVVYLPDSHPTKRVQEMTGQGAEVLRIPGSWQDVVARSKQRAEDDDLYDANPGGANTGLQIRAYGEIADEICADHRDAPAAVALPISNGTTLAGVHRGFVRLLRRGKTSRIPMLIVGSPLPKNPIVVASSRNPLLYLDGDAQGARRTAHSEPLISWHAGDGQAALEAIRCTRGFAAHTSEKALLQCASMVSELEGLIVPASSTAGLAALLERHRNQPLPGDRYVAIVTGRKTGRDPSAWFQPHR